MCTPFSGLEVSRAHERNCSSNRSKVDLSIRGQEWEDDGVCMFQYPSERGCNPRSHYSHLLTKEIGVAPRDYEVHTRCQIYSNALHLDPLLPAADLVITNGNLATSARALLAGVPVLALPHVTEQQLGALRIASLGAGLVAGADPTQTRTPSLWRRPLTREIFRQTPPPPPRPSPPPTSPPHPHPPRYHLP